MSYSLVPRRAVLGLDPATAYAAYKTGSTVVNTAAPILQRLFGGGQDEKRKARVDLMENYAKRGSVLAARIIIAAPANVGSNEDPFWEAARQRVPGAVLAEALRQGPFWPVGAPFEMPDQIAQIERELAAIEQSPNYAQTAAPGATGRVQQLPGMTTTAPYNYLPWAIGAGVALFLLSRK